MPGLWIGPSLGVCERQPVDVSLTHWCFSLSLSLSPSFSLSLKINTYNVLKKNVNLTLLSTWHKSRVYRWSPDRTCNKRESISLPLYLWVLNFNGQQNHLNRFFKEQSTGPLSEFLIQWAWVRDSAFEFLTGFQVILMMLVPGPQGCILIPEMTFFLPLGFAHTALPCIARSTLFSQL